MGFPPPPKTEAQVDAAWNEIEKKFESSVTASLEDAAEKERVRAEQGYEDAKRILASLEKRIAERRSIQEKPTIELLTINQKQSRKNRFPPSSLEATRSKVALKRLQEADKRYYLDFHDFLEFLYHVNLERLNITTPEENIIDPESAERLRHEFDQKIAAKMEVDEARWRYVNKREQEMFAFIYDMNGRERLEFKQAMSDEFDFLNR